jgi:hypothetical protein
MKKVAASKALRRFPALRMDANEIKKEMTPVSAQERQRIRMDSWQNVITGAGVLGRDKRMAGRLSWSGIMPETEAEQTYASDELARRMVELVPRECLKNWIKFEGLEELTGAVEEELFRLKAPERFFEASCWARIYGGAALFMATGEEPEEFEEPLDPKNFDRVESLVLFSKWELLVRSTDLENDINDPNYGRPKFYWLTPRKGNISTLFSVKIHHSRLIRFDGKKLPLRLTVFNRYWGDSIYTGVLEAMRDYGLAHSSMSSVLQEFRVAVYKMKDLVDQLASADSQVLQERLAKINAVRSVFGTYFLDEDESMEFHSDTFAGVRDMLQALKERLQACTDIPHIVLFNESPGGKSGMGQTGDASLESWYSFLDGEQKNYYTRKLDQLIVTMLQAPKGPTAGQEPEGWDWEFNKTQTLDENGKADLETKQLANTDKRIGMGVDDVFDAMERHNPDKLKTLNLKDKDRMKAALDQVVSSELERRGDPGAAVLPQLPTDKKPLVKERDKVVVPSTPPKMKG